MSPLLQHTIVLLSYTGIWFISGAVSHGFFSGTRSIIMVLLGMSLFIIAQLLESRYIHKDQSKTAKHYIQVWAIAILFSLWVGMFNGWLQHFLDSPLRSLRIIPLGYLLSVIIFPYKEELKKIARTPILKIALPVTLILAVLGYATYRILPESVYLQVWHDHSNPIQHTADDDHHNDQDTSNYLKRDAYNNEEKLNIHICIMGGEEFWGENCAEITDTTNRNLYEDAIREQCEVMPGMDFCDEYLGTITLDPLVWTPYDLSIQDSDVTTSASQIVELNDGAKYDMAITRSKSSIAGKERLRYTYDGSVPGPTLKVQQWSQITLNVTNSIQDIETTVHHHGLRLDHTQDGVPISMGGFDIPANYGETLNYTLDFPDPGVYRYHPHVREELQQDMGMYGNYIVTPTDPTYRNPVDEEHILMLDDVLILDGEIVPYYQEMTTHSIMGRFWNQYLINGSENYTLNLEQNKVYRLYVTNSANVRVFNLQIPGLQMKLVGGDIGAYQQETMIDDLLIWPAERYIIEIATPTSGTFEILYKNPAFTTTLWTVVVKPNNQVSQNLASFETLRSHSAVHKDIEQYSTYFDTEPDKILRLDMTLHGKTKDDLSLAMHTHDGDTSAASMWWLEYPLWLIEREDMMYEMNSLSTDQHTVRQMIDEKTGKMNSDIDRSFEQGDVVKVRIINDDHGLHPMHHTIHFHGQRFLVLEKNGVKNTNLVWKDTVLTLPGDTIDILIDMSNPGYWMAHCHISEHMHAGMMLHYSVGKNRWQRMMKKLGHRGHKH